MSALKVLFTNKSQTLPYDAQKMNAQDANELKFAINANAELLDNVTTLNTASFAGQAQTSTNPGTPTSQKWYFAKPGTYTHFFNSSAAAIVVPATSSSLDVLVAILYWTGTAWDSILLTVDLTEITDQLDALEVDKQDKADLPTFSKQNDAVVGSKDVLYAIRDVNGDVLFAIYTDGTTNIVDVAALNTALINEAATRAAADTALQTSITSLDNDKIDKSDFDLTTLPDALIGTKEILYAIKDVNGDVLFAIYTDGTTTADYVPPTNPLNATLLDEAWLNFKKVIYAIVDANSDVVIAYFDDGTNSVGDFAALQSEIVAARGLQPSLNDRFKNAIKAYAIPTTPVWGGERLRRWIEWNRSRDYRYDLLLIGDSYTHGFYSVWLRNFLLADGYPNGGAGWCSFSRWGDSPLSYNSSVTPDDLHFSYTTSEWAFTNTNSLGLNGHVTSTVANATITIIATQLVNAITIVFEKHSGAGDFQWRVNGGGWSTVSTANATQIIGTLTIDTSALSAAFTIEVQALSTGIIMLGCIGRKTGNVLNIHKAGISGGNAGMFAQNQIWSDNAALVTPQGVAIMFGTNEMSGNTLPSVFRTNIQNIITKVRAINPYCDVLLMCPTYTKYETENPTAYSLDAYAQVLFELAVANDAAFLNYTQVFGAFSQASVDAGFMNADRIHPGVGRGSKLMAETFVKLLK